VDGVVLTDFQTGLALGQLLTHAGLFVLPSSHEGLPIALLEALGHGLRVLASDIPANLEVGLDAQCYFPLGDISALAVRLRELSEKSQSGKEERRRWVAKKYDWDNIAKQTFAVYQKAINS
jgi:glycosyltransferase involved in cell wall biosynthesis